MNGSTMGQDALTLLQADLRELLRTHFLPGARYRDPLCDGCLKVEQVSRAIAALRSQRASMTEAELIAAKGGLIL